MVFNALLSLAAPRRWLAMSLPAVVLIACSCAGAEPVAPRWNILFCFADDLGRYGSCYAGLDGRPSLNDVVRTPHMDRVARKGVLFKNAFANAPSCTPSRSALFSGRQFFNTGRGAILVGAVWDDTIPTFPLLLRDAGYHIGKSYKVWTPGTPPDAPFAGQQYAYEQGGDEPNHFSGAVTGRVRRGASVGEARDEMLANVRLNFDAFLADRRPAQPWLYFFGAKNTHRAWMKGSGKALWGINPDDLKGRLPAFLPDVPEVREDVADYLGEVQAFDTYVGVLLERLEAAGELERTLVVISGDQGMPGVPRGKCNLYDHGVAVPLIARIPGGKEGRVIEDFVSLPDLAPTFMQIGGVVPPAGLYGRNLLPLLQSQRSGQIEPDRTWVISGRERHGDRAREGNLPYPSRALRTRDFLYIRNFASERWPMGDPREALNVADTKPGAHETDSFIGFSDMDRSPTKAWVLAHRQDPRGMIAFDLAFSKRPGEELYDLRRDPDQVENIATDPAYGAIRRQLADELMRRLTAAGDPRVIGDQGTFDRPPFTDAVLPERNPPREKLAK